MKNKTADQKIASVSSLVRLGFIGCGNYSRQLAAKASVAENVRPTACCDTSVEAATSFAEQYGLAVETSLESLLRRDDIDAVVIATPNSSHRSCACAAFEAGKHVFVDKPIANTVEDAKAMIAAAQKFSRVLAVGHNVRRRAGFRKMKAMVAAGAIGEVVQAEANFSHPGIRGMTPDSWRNSPIECPALPLTQLGVHCIDTLLFLLGEVHQVSSLMDRRVIRTENVDNTVTLLRFGNGILSTLGASYASQFSYHINLYGTEGHLCCKKGEHLIFRKDQDSPEEVVPLDPVDDQLDQLEEFGRCIRKGTVPEVNGTVALQSVIVLNAAIRSAASGQVVSII